MSDKEPSGNESSDEYKCPVDECDYTSSSEHGANIHFGSHDSEIKRQVYISEIQRLADLNDRTPKEDDMIHYGRFSPAAIRNFFGGWNDGLKAAGFNPNQANRTPAELLEELPRLADKLGRTPRSMDLKVHSDYSIGHYDYHFGGWNKALKEAGFETNQDTLPSEDELIAEIRRLADELGRVPFHHDMTEHGKYGYRSYFRRFGSWELSLKAAGFDPYTPADIAPTGEDHPGWKGGQFLYGPGWNEAKKEQVRERDERRCQSCGRSEEEHIRLQGRKHSVHHIQKARAVDDPEERNHPNNLVTLCETEKCHKAWEQMAPLRPQVVRSDDD